MRKNLLFTFLLLNVKILFSQIPCPYDSIIYNGITYHTVAIGNQCWLKENLNIGTMIDSTLEQTDNSIVEKYCYNNDLARCNQYGALYQWDEIMNYTLTNGTQGICPNGWHVPTDAEWYELENYVDPSINNSSYMGDRGTTAGISLQANGSSGLDILCAGQNYGQQFMYIESLGYYWTSTNSPNPGSCVNGPLDCFAYYRRFYTGLAQIMRYDNNGATYRPKGVGMSVRCICGVGNTVSISQESLDQTEIGLYPNPGERFFEVNLSSDKEEVQLYISDVYGKIVFNEYYYTTGTSINLDLDFLSNGFYYLTIKDNSQNKIKKFVINK